MPRKQLPPRESAHAPAARGSRVRETKPDAILPGDMPVNVTVKHQKGYLERPYFKGYEIVKNPAGKFFIKLGDGITCWMFAPDTDEERTFVHLIGEPLVAAFAPLDVGEKRGQAIQHAQINGLRFNILKGRVVKVPASVQEIIAESFNQTVEAVAGAKTLNASTGEERSANLAYRSEEELRSLSR